MENVDVMSPRQIPKLLGHKLKTIREGKGWSLDKMAEVLGKKEPSRRTRVFEWEQGIRQPDLNMLLVYAKLANVSVETLIDDDIRLDIKP
jgi:transcriptional regulator with XRE-family HTH domain